MPSAALRYCAVPRCKNLVRTGPRCAEHARPSWPVRPSARARGYTYEWDRASREMRERGDPCVDCNVNKAEELDHIIPLSKGGSTDPWLNGAGRCGPCHDRKSGRDRVSGTAPI